MTTLEYLRPDGARASGYWAAGNPDGAAIIVIQEWWGLNDQIRGVADRLERAGYTAFVPDLYRGKSTVEAEEAHHLMEGLNFQDAAAMDIRGAVQALKARGAPKVGITGFCMGGALSLLSACLVPEADATVVWYGHPPIDAIDATKIKAPLLAHWSTQDSFFPIEGVEQVEAKLRAAGVAYEGHRYLAYHGFANETSQGPGRKLPALQYDAGWSQVAWDRTLRFFGRSLG